MKNWTNARLDLYFIDNETGDIQKRTFRFLKEGVQKDQVDAFGQAIASLSSLDYSHHVLIEEYQLG